MNDLIIRNSLKAVLSPNLLHEAKDKSGDKSFGEVLKQSINEVNELQQEADQAIKELTTGENISIHQTMIALEKADISFKLLMQVRNKLVEAYQDVMRMQL